MPGASLRNAVKRKTHKERAQPARRARLGLLEKKSDYRARAADFHKKEATLKSLARKAEARNPDEFYFGMHKARTDKGVAVVDTATPNKYSAKELRLMRTQDVRYLASRATHEARAAERLARSLHGIGAAERPNPSSSSKNPSHVVFVDSAPQVRRFDPVRHFGTPAELLERHYNRPRLLGGGGDGDGGSNNSAKAAAAAASSSSPPPLVAFPRGTRPDRAAMKADRQRLASYAELARRRRRAAKLAGLEGALRRTQALSGKGRVRRLSPAEALRATGGESDGRGVKGKVYKWAKVRKR